MKIQVLIVLTVFISGSYDSFADSAFTIDTATAGSPAPKEVLDSQVLIDVIHLGLDGKTHLGQLVVDRALASEISVIFSQLFTHRFPINKIRPVVVYNWSDSISMAENNTSAFNYRRIENTDRMSRHAYGRAIDINPFLNPYIRVDTVLPAGSHYSPELPGTITDTSIVVRLFEERGWEWGGRWTSSRDYQHFEKH
jgi:hypothetical protein